MQSIQYSVKSILWIKNDKIPYTKEKPGALRRMKTGGDLYVNVARTFLRKVTNRTSIHYFLNGKT